MIQNRYQGRLYVCRITDTEALVNEIVLSELIESFDIENFLIETDARDLARHMTLRDHDIFKKISPDEYLDFLWKVCCCAATPFVLSVTSVFAWIY